MAARKTAAQKAAEAAERDEYTGTTDHSAAENAAAKVEAANPTDPENNLTDVVDDKGKRLTVQQLKNKLRNEAEREVLDTHRPEVITLTAAKYKLHNLEYVRRLTDEEKAAKQIEELYEKFPQLRPQGQAFEETIVVSPKQHQRMVKAEQGGPLEQFRNEGHDTLAGQLQRDAESDFPYDAEYGQPDGDQ